MAASAISQVPSSSAGNDEMILRVRKSVGESPTTIDNLHKRHHALRAWIHQLLNAGIYIDASHSREQADELNGLMRKNNWIEACTQVDAAFLNLEKLQSKLQEKKEKALQQKIYHELSFSTIANEVKIIKSLPVQENGVEIKGRPGFITSTATGIKKDGFITLEISNEPIWIIEGRLPHTKNLRAENSPFGFHPASPYGYSEDYSLAQEIGVDWDRASYLLWVFGQPDLNEKQYDWIKYDRYFKNLPDGIKPLKNISVVHDGMIERPDRRVKHRERKVIISQHLEGTTYLPNDVKAYSLWVQAVVERYDGDGENDMPGLKTPAKYWQIDNEPYSHGRTGYAELIRITSQAIKKADITAKVLIGGLILPFDDIRLQKYKNSILPIIKSLNGKNIDILDMHWYSQAGEWKMLPQVLVVLRNDLQTYGFNDIPIWFTEMGTYSGKPYEPHLPIHFKWQSEQDQAQEMLKCYVVALGENVKKIFWAWGIIEGFQDPNDNDFFDNTGFIYNGIGSEDPGKGVKKISYWTYQKMTQLLQYWDGSRPEKIDVDKNIFAYRFRFSNDENRGIVIVWQEDETLTLEDEKTAPSEK